MDTQTPTPDTEPNPATVEAAATAETTTATAGELDTLRSQLEDLQARHTEVSDAYLRAKAETENIRRRAEEETSKVRKFAVEAFAESLLPVKDSLEAALANPDASSQLVLEGVQTTLRQLTHALERHKVLPIEPAPGSRFDPHHHQAISVVPSEHDAGTVVTLLQKGYLIADRVLRPALVTVAATK